LRVAPESEGQAGGFSISGTDNAALLTGKFFHSFAPAAKYPDAPTGIVEWQGRVLGRVDNQTYLIELISWSHGLPSGQRLQSIASMSGWRFYPTADEMRDWYEEDYSPLVAGYCFVPAENRRGGA
jgi:hypothetical protein